MLFADRDRGREIARQGGIAPCGLGNRLVGFDAQLQEHTAAGHRAGQYPIADADRRRRAFIQEVYKRKPPEEVTRGRGQRDHALLRQLDELTLLTFTESYGR